MQKYNGSRCNGKVVVLQSSAKSLTESERGIEKTVSLLDRLKCPTTLVLNRTYKSIAMIQCWRISGEIDTA